MPISVVMPALEMAQETGKLVSWLKKEGDRVTKGDPLFEVETDKAVMEVEASGAGLLAGITAQPGTEIPVGKTIAWIVQPGESPPTQSEQVTIGRHVTVDTAPTTSASDTATSATPKVLVSPKARRLAEEKGLDLANVRGSGRGGEILAADVLAASAGSQAAIATETVSTVAKLMAKRVTEAWTTIPHFFVVREIDAGSLKAAREQFGPGIEHAHKTNLTFTDLLIAIVARTLSRHKLVNASWINGRVQYNPEINVSVAMAVEGGVVAPVISNADRLSLGEIAALRRDLGEKAQAGKLRPVNISGGTFTISNLGMFDVDEFTAIITPPQVAILAVGRIGDRVVSINSQPVVRPMMTMTLSCDHRVLDGAAAALFMRDLVNGISETEATNE
jgi:pyruvate dehydrogenase E2 component (dihydrolipoamide acetyltransferase)